MELRQLRHFACVIETGSFSAAALKLGLSQSALSRSVLTLEHSLGAQLIDRAGKRCELTPLGRVVFERGQSVIFESEEIEQDLKRLQGRGLGSLAVGMGPWPSALLTQPLLKHMAEHFPGVRLHLRRGAIEEQLTQLRERSLDALIVDPRTIDSVVGLRLESVTDFRAGFFCRPNHPLANGRPVKFKDMLAFPIASSPFSAEAARTMVSLYGEQGAPEKLLSLSCEEYAHMMDLARTTDTIHIGSMALAHASVNAGALTELPVAPKLKGSQRIGMVTLARRTEAPAMTILRRFLLSTLRETVRLAR